MFCVSYQHLALGCYWDYRYYFHCLHSLVSSYNMPYLSPSNDFFCISCFSNIDLIIQTINGCSDFFDNIFNLIISSVETIVFIKIYIMRLYHRPSYWLYKCAASSTFLQVVGRIYDRSFTQFGAYSFKNTHKMVISNVFHQTSKMRPVNLNLF